MEDRVQVFDRRSLRRQRERAAGTLAQHDFLLREVAERLAERLEDVTRGFPLALDVGCHDGALGRALAGRVELVLARRYVRVARDGFAGRKPVVEAGELHLHARAILVDE